MSKNTTFSLFFLANFLQAGTYGLTFMLPRLFATFGANEKYVGGMLFITTIATLISVYYSGHLTDKFGRLYSLGFSGFTIALSLFLFGWTDSVGPTLVFASVFLGLGWGVFYTLGPVVLTRITATENRVRAFSMNTVFIMAGFGLSPVLVSVMENAGFSISQAFYLMAGVCLVSGGIFMLLRMPIQSLTLDKNVERKSSLTVSGVVNVFSSRARLPVMMVCLGASVFAGMSNFQTVFADNRGLQYADFFLTYTITVIICRVLLAGFSGGKSPYAMIAGLQYIMCASVVLFIFSGDNSLLYLLVAILFGIGYGASYPILAAMAANDSEVDSVPQTLQLFALTYFIGIFGFPLIAGWVIVESGVTPLLTGVAVLAFIEASMALQRILTDRRVA